MHCSGRCACYGTPPGVFRSRTALHQPIAALARPFQNGFSTRGSASRLSEKKRTKIVNQADVSSQASVTLRAPSGAQQTALQQQDLAVPRSLLIAVDYTSDADQALQWALDFVVKPGVYRVLCRFR